MKTLTLLLSALALWGYSLSAAADPSCEGRFVNPITDVCWRCIFPLSLGSVQVGKGDLPDTSNPGSPLQLCPAPPPLFVRPGLAIGYPWYTGNILFAFAVTGQALRWFSLPFWRYTFAAMAIVAVWIPFSCGSYGMAGVAMLTVSWLLCRAQHATERLSYGALWAIMVLLMNINDVSESVAGLAIALLVLMVCSSVGGEIKRFWPRHFFVMFYAVHLAVLGVVATM